MNEHPPGQLHFDFRTGSPTSFTGNALTEIEWRNCVSLNRARARGIAEIARQTPSRQSLSLDVWTGAVAARSKQWDIPLISLEKLGLYFDELQALASHDLVGIGEGKEASAWLDKETRCVYKLFDLRAHGALGQKLVFERVDNFDFRLAQVDAVLSDIVSKLELLHEAGACPTEIIGLTTTGDYLVAKQPMCGPYKNFQKDCETATVMMKAVRPPCSLGMPAYIFWLQGEPWILGDLHHGNIRTNTIGVPVVIDALIGPIPPSVLKYSIQLKQAAEDAQHWRKTDKPRRSSISDNVRDEDL